MSEKNLLEDAGLLTLGALGIIFLFWAAVWCWTSITKLFK